MLLLMNMSDISISAIFKNGILITTLSAFFFTQFIKLILNTLREHRFDFRWLVGTGGMPSAHTAGAMALCTTTGLRLGFDSSLFAITAIFAIITMFDAQGVRRSIGRQAIILNKFIEDIYWQGKIKEERVKELIGHTPVEVLIGAIIGILVALILI